MCRQKNKIGVFYKIALIILLFTSLTYFLAINLEDDQYSEQDIIIEYQSLLLYQMMAEHWSRDSLDSQLINDLNRLKLSAFIGLYHDSDSSQTLNFKSFEDINQNQVRDDNESIFPGDSLIQLWSHKRNKPDFNPQDPDGRMGAEHYNSLGDKDFIAQDLELIQEVNSPYASYGFYGPNGIPAVFLEFPINNNQWMAYWLILDHPLPTDRFWPSIVLSFTIPLILIFVFWVISSFLYPIQLMIQHVRNLKQGSLNKKIPIISNDELGELTAAINQMTEDINLLINQKDDLLLDVSHELKTPLTRLKFILANMDIEEHNKRELNNEINSFKDMISNMLLSDKLSTPYIEDLKKEEVLIDDFIKVTCDMFYQINKEINIKNQVGNQVLYIDKYKMSLALKNLIDNALKYKDCTKLIDLIFSEENKYICCTVQDYGKGIQQTQINKIIQPLYRGRQAKEKNHGGFGLGLAIAKKIIEAHNGQLKIKSTIGKGSKFMLLIPKRHHEKY